MLWTLYFKLTVANIFLSAPGIDFVKYPWFLATGSWVFQVFSDKFHINHVISINNRSFQSYWWFTQIHIIKDRIKKHQSKTSKNLVPLNLARLPLWAIRHSPESYGNPRRLTRIWQSQSRGTKFIYFGSYSLRNVWITFVCDYGDVE